MLRLGAMSASMMLTLYHSLPVSARNRASITIAHEGPLQHQSRNKSADCLALGSHGTQLRRELKSTAGKYGAFDPELASGWKNVYNEVSHRQVSTWPEPGSLRWDILEEKATYRHEDLPREACSDLSRRLRCALLSATKPVPFWPPG